jgi:hypothetical protein
MCFFSDGENKISIQKFCGKMSWLVDVGNMETCFEQSYLLLEKKIMTVLTQIQ